MLVLAACSGGGSDDEARLRDFADLADAVEADADAALPCADTFAAGRPVADVIAEAAAGPCLNDAEVTYVAVVSWECPDGASVHQVDGFGWGRDGGAWNGPEVPAPYADCTSP